MLQKKFDIAEQIEQEHACLKRDMAEIKEDVMREIGTQDFSEWRLEFMWRLRDFRNHLCKHFDLEDESGFMSDIVEEAPETVNRVAQLEAEHSQILSDLDEILVGLKMIEIGEATELESLRSRVAGLISTLLSHEAAEHELIQKVYCREYGYPA